MTRSDDDSLGDDGFEDAPLGCFGRCMRTGSGRNRVSPSARADDTLPADLESTLLPAEAFEAIRFHRGTAADARFKPMVQTLLKGNGDVKGLVERLRSPDAAVQQQCLWALAMSAAASRPDCKTIVAAGALPRLVTLLRSSPPEVGRNAARCLRYLAGKSTSRSRAMVNAGVLPVLAGALGSEDAGLAEQAAFTLKAVAAAGEGLADEIARAKVVPALVKLLQHTTVGAALQAAGALSQLSAVGDEMREDIIHAGGIPCVVALLSHPVAPLAREAASLLAQLAAGGVAHVIIASGALMPLVNGLADANAGLAERSLKALLLLAGQSGLLAAKIKEAGAVALAMGLEHRLNAGMASQADRLLAILQASRLEIRHSFGSRSPLLDSQPPALAHNHRPVSPSGGAAAPSPMLPSRVVRASSYSHVDLYQ